MQVVENWDSNPTFCWGSPYQASPWDVKYPDLPRQGPLVILNKTIVEGTLAVKATLRIPCPRCQGCSRICDSRHPLGTCSSSTAEVRCSPTPQVHKHRTFIYIYIYTYTYIYIYTCVFVHLFIIFFVNICIYICHRI